MITNRHHLECLQMKIHHIFSMNNMQFEHDKNQVKIEYSQQLTLAMYDQNTYKINMDQIMRVNHLNMSS